MGFLQFFTAKPCYSQKPCAHEYNSGRLWHRSRARTHEVIITAAKGAVFNFAARLM